MDLRTLLPAALLLLSAAAAADELNGTLISDGGSCTLLETLDGKRYIPDSTGGFPLGAQVHVSGTVDPSCFHFCFGQIDGCVWGATVTGGWTIDECGTLINDGFGCVMVEMPDGRRYIPDDGGGGYPIGATVNVQGDLDPSCASFCGPNDGCLWNAVTTACAGTPPGTVYCVGNGSGTLCPCGNDNDGSNGLAGCANGVHAGGASLSGTGAASVGADTVQLAVTGLPAGQPGLFFRADSAVNGGNGTIFGDGLRCAGGNVVRLQTVFADGSGNALSALGMGAGLSAGDTRRYQFWYRDPLTSPCGAFFNLSNGYEITWGL